MNKFFIVTTVIFCILLSGCGMFTPAQKPEVGPTGKPVESKANPPFLERFYTPPGELYDLEATSGVIFEGINKEKWDQAETGFNNLQTIWINSKPLIGEKKGVKEADKALQELNIAIAGKKTTNSYESLNKFMGSIGDIAKSYKLSPLAGLIGVGNAIRNVNFYVEDKNWSKAASKVKELEGVWGNVKPTMEQVGILAEVTRTHSLVKQMKDAVAAENKGAIEEHTANLNESLGYIRNFFRGK
ncbi:hypothetical protein SDC9_05858 [bioreactor metagenome]|uniref:Lipoprotein n=1 Tax=bioreactor metagenome TaxID=1076179 RepID=A0A644T026_9ZZZZ|nr:hypothetical protein [Negativicutes bacterium]